MPSVSYDTGALIAAERGDRRLWELHRRTLERGLVPCVPAGVLAQGWRGGPQPQMSRFLAGCRVEDLDETRARSAGAACGLAGTSDIVDAAVVVGAAARTDLVVTSDAADLSRLRDALGVELEVCEICATEWLFLLGSSRARVALVLSGQDPVYPVNLHRLRG